MSDYALGTTIYIQFTTRAFATGVPTTLAGSPVLSVLEENNATPITSGVSVAVDRASVTGLNEATIVASGGNGYEAGKQYALYISTGTVGGTSVVGEVVGHFCIEKESPLRPTTAGRTVDITATGAAGIDWANVEGQSTAVNLSATNIDVDQVVATVTNQLTAAQIATGIWQDTTAGDFTVAGSIGRSLFTSGILPGAAGGLFIAGSNAATTIAGLTTGAFSCTTFTASGTVAFQSTFAVTTSTSLGALSCTTLTASGAVALQSTVTITGTTTFAAMALTTLNTSGTVTFNALTISNNLLVSGTTTHTGAVSFGSTFAITGAFTATNAGNNITGITVGAVTIAAGGITAASFAANAIDSAALAASAVTEIQTGLATLTNQTTLLANDVKLLAAVYDSAPAAGTVITLSNGATQTVTAAGRVTV